MYEGFFTSLDDSYIRRLGDAIGDAGFAMPMLCCSPNFTHPDADERAKAVDKEAQMIRISKLLGGERRGMSGAERATLPECQTRTGLTVGDRMH